MRNLPIELEETTLDPLDWTAMKALGHRMLDDLFDYLQTVSQRPPWKKPGDYAISSMQQPLPQWPQEAATVYEEFFTQILPYNLNNTHPRFWGWVQGGGTPIGMLADLLASGMNTNVSIGNNMPMHVEHQVLNWSKEMMGFPATASGLLTSGASMANITALIVARNQASNTIKSKGLQAQAATLTMYGSSETHNCVRKAAEVIGIGHEHFRQVPVDKQFKIRIADLRKIITEDRQAGYQPFCIIGNAGTVNTGAIDDLAELAQVAREEGLWFHIDGAFGAIPKLLPEYGKILKGIEEADSLSFDFHKWLYVNYEAACVLIKDAAAHRAAFATTGNYLLAHDRGAAAGPDAFSNYGMELSRGFKALKIWMSLKTYGLEQYRQQIRQNLRQAGYLAASIKLTSTLELLADVPLNIVCYRFNPGSASDEELNTLNKEILVRLHEEGIAIPTYTVLNNRYCIRVAITNHRSRLEDFDALVQETVRIGQSLIV